MLAYILVPIICGIIGYFTNYLAIKMLFYPLEAHCLFGHKLPFTPGIIPKGKKRIANSISIAINDNLMNKEVLEHSLLSEDMIKKISGDIDGFVSKIEARDETIVDFISHYVEKDKLTSVIDTSSSMVISTISDKLKDQELSDYLGQIVMQQISKTLNKSIMGRMMEKVFLSTSTKLEESVSKHLNQIMNENADSIVGGLVKSQIDEYSSMNISDLMINHPEKIEKIKAYVISSYKRIITEKLPHILETIDISKMIEDRIMEMDIKETEQLLLDVIGKELHMVEILGGVLGAIIGALNLLFL